MSLVNISRESGVIHAWEAYSNAFALNRANNR